jgi:hypothetical protein
LAKLPAIPSVSSRVPTEISALLRPMREILTAFTTGDSQVVSIGSLRRAGIIGGTDGDGVLIPPGGFDIPPAPTGLAAGGALASIILTWDSIGYGRVSHTEIWRAQTDDFSLAQLVGRSDGFIYVDPVGGAAVRYYWIRYVSYSNNPGPFNAQSGTMGETGQDPAYLLDLLTGQITETQLYADLGARINLIDAEGTGLVDRVDALVATYGDTASAAESAAEAAQSAADAVAAEAAALGASTDAIAAKAAALLAQGSAESAALASESSRISAESAKAGADTSAAAAATSETNAASYATSAEAASTAANNSKLAAEAAKTDSATSATAAATSATSAATSATNAAASATASDSAKLSAEAAKADAATSASASATSATNASSYATAAESAASAANTYKLAAESAKGSAESAATAAVTAKDTAVTKASEASTSAAAASTSATTAATKAGEASTSATNAATSETNAAGSASSASTSASNAAGSATAAGGSATAAAGSASTAATHATNAGNSASAASAAQVAAESARDTAAGHASAASTSASTANTRANDAQSYANAASSSANTASTAASNALTYRDSAASSATTAEGYATAAATDYTAVNARLDNAGGTGVTVEQKLTANADSITGLNAQYTVKISTDNVSGGFGLATTGPTDAPTLDFGVRSNRFYVAPPSNFIQESTPSATAVGQVWYKPSTKETFYSTATGTAGWSLVNPTIPFVVQTTDQVVNGVTIPKGVYMDAAYIKNLTALVARLGNAWIDNAMIADLSAEKINAGDIAATRMSANIVTALSGKFSSLSAITANLGTATISSTGFLNTTDAVAYGTGVGIWMGYSGGAYKFRVGDPNGQYIKWDGAILKMSGSLMSGAYTSYAWPSAGQTGYYLGAEGLLIGNYNNGKYVQIDIDGNLYMPQFSVVNGNATFSGALSAATGTFSGSLSAATGTFSGTLTASAINAINTINLAGNAVTQMIAGSGTSSISFPTMTTYGGSVQILVQSFFTVGAGSSGGIVVKRDGVTITGNTRTNASESSMEFDLSVLYVDTPSGSLASPGSHTYTVTVVGGVSVYATLFEAKR